MKSKTVKVSILSKYNDDIEFVIWDWILNNECHVNFINEQHFKIKDTFDLLVGDSILFNFSYENEIKIPEIIDTAIDWFIRKNKIRTNWEKGKIENEKYYSSLISNTEKRYVSYKKQIADLYKNKNIIVPEDFDWFMNSLKESKNFEEKLLKSLIKEWTEMKIDYGY